MATTSEALAGGVALAQVEHCASPGKFLRAWWTVSADDGTEDCRGGASGTPRGGRLAVEGSNKKWELFLLPHEEQVVW